MQTLYKHPSTDQFRSIVRAVTNKARFAGLDENGEAIYNHAPLPTLTFTGTVKLHGTNMSIVLTKDGDYYAQSRERVLSLTSDNAGSCMYVMQHRDFFEPILQKYLTEGVEAVVLCGEWAGQGIQKGVGISEIPKTFFPFLLATKHVDGSTKKHSFPMGLYVTGELHVQPIDLFKTFKIDIDFNQHEMAINQMIAMVEAVENECPVAKAFGISGIGEGIVFSNGEYVFKCKGEKHSVSKVKTLIPVDVERLQGIQNFVEYALTEARLEQGVQSVVGLNVIPEAKDIGAFLSWINKDVIKEETDVLVANGLDMKVVGKAVSTKARTWYINKYL